MQDQTVVDASLARGRGPLIIFVALAYGLSWLVWGAVLAAERGLISFRPARDLAFLGLGLGAFAAAALTGGRAALADLFRRMGRWRVAPRWYAATLLVAVSLSLIPALLYRLLFGPLPAPALALRLVPVYFVFQIILHLLTEETAWRGFALPRLQARFGALPASLILGLLWALWHTPLFFLANTSQSKMPFPGFVLDVVAVTIVMTWVYNHTRGSVLLAALFHAAFNASGAYFNTLTSDARLFWLTVGVACVVALALLWIAGPARLGRPATAVGPAATGAWPEGATGRMGS
jgi:membrane protease YdiL (CAAX protease family)